MPPPAKPSKTIDKTQKWWQNIVTHLQEKCQTPLCRNDKKWETSQPRNNQMHGVGSCYSRQAQNVGSTLSDMNAPHGCLTHQMNQKAEGNILVMFRAVWLTPGEHLESLCFGAAAAPESREFPFASDTGGGPYGITVFFAFELPSRLTASCSYLRPTHRFCSQPKSCTGSPCRREPEAASCRLAWVTAPTPFGAPCHPPWPNQLFL